MNKKILCPTRGGKASYPNQDRAISIAKEDDAALVFLYVSNVSFLDSTPLSKLIDLETELDEMGEFILAVVKERAEKAGVVAETIVRRGVFHEVLKEVVETEQVSKVVMGCPKEGTGSISKEYIQDLSERLCKETGVEFVVVYEGDVEKVVKP